eukprot:8804849-Ditylum_brightwellii.AAC.1
MAEVTLNTLSQSSNRDKLTCEKQRGKANDMSEQNRLDGQQTAIEGEQRKEDKTMIVEEKQTKNSISKMRKKIAVMRIQAVVLWKKRIQLHKMKNSNSQ